jgi:hypothetical protein
LAAGRPVAEGRTGKGLGNRTAICLPEQVFNQFACRTPQKKSPQAFSLFEQEPLEPASLTISMPTNPLSRSEDYSSVFSTAKKVQKVFSSFSLARIE